MMGKLSMLERAVDSLDQAVKHLKDAADFADEADLEVEAADLGAVVAQAQGYRSILFQMIGDEVMALEPGRKDEEDDRQYPKED